MSGILSVICRILKIQIVNVLFIWIVNVQLMLFGYLFLLMLIKAALSIGIMNA
jgi:hypothetical protein